MQEIARIQDISDLQRMDGYVIMLTDITDIITRPERSGIFEGGRT